MSCLAWIGALTYFFGEERLRKIVHPFVALAAGTLLGGALFHLLPEAVSRISNPLSVFLSFAFGFVALLFVELFLEWQHEHQHHLPRKKPIGYLILIADALHNFIGGLGVGAAMLIDVKLGLTAWIAAALHELPQEIGDFGILVESGWSRKNALLFNFFSALTFPLGGLSIYLFAENINVTVLVPFAAGNFVYIAASGLIPEIKHCHNRLFHSVVNFLIFCFGLGFLYVLARMFS